MFRIRIRFDAAGDLYFTSDISFNTREDAAEAATHMVEDHPELAMRVAIVRLAVV